MTIEMSAQPLSSARALNASQRDKLRARLEADLADLHSQQDVLRAQINSANESRRDVGTDESEDPEGSALAFERAQAASMLEQSVRHALEISHALGKLDAGTYGDCEECDTHIPHARLDARPAAALCISCAS